MNVGEQISVARRARGWSLRHLAELAAMSHVFLMNIERSEKWTRADRIALLARLLGLDPGRMLLAYADEQAAAARGRVLGGVEALGTDE